MNFKSFAVNQTLVYFFAANSGVSKKGIENSFLSVSGVFMNPGEITETLTLNFLKSKKILSAKLVKAAFEGPYPLEFGKPL